ncbi:Exocyst complex component Exo70 [Sesbania bispinosa]|nr:Exocyst complex component Exo70 [Sesbania bispinosa]
MATLEKPPIQSSFSILVLTITSVFSFFSDKVMNGKPDAYSLISCAAFAIMSLSLSRQTQCGFEVDLLYFFLECLTVQLMKIKLELVIVGAGFSYSLIILRSSFSSINPTVKTSNLGLQDQHIVIQVDSQQLANTDTEVCHGAAIQLLNYADAFVTRSPSAWLLFQTLDMFDTLREMIPDFESLFPDSLVKEAIRIQNRLGEATRDIFMELGI